MLFKKYGYTYFVYKNSFCCGIFYSTSSQDLPPVVVVVVEDALEN